MLSEDVVRQLRDAYWAQCQYFEAEWRKPPHEDRLLRMVEYYGTMTGVLDAVLEENDE